MSQKEFFPDRKPRRDWSLREAKEALEHFEEEAARLGMTGKDADDWARARTWEHVEGQPISQPDGESDGTF